jgi:hypothetical protein
MQSTRKCPRTTAGRGREPIGYSWVLFGMQNRTFGPFLPQVFFSIALFMGEGVYQIVKMLWLSYNHYKTRRAQLAAGIDDDTGVHQGALPKLH